MCNDSGILILRLATLGLQCMSGSFQYIDSWWTGPTPEASVFHLLLSPDFLRMHCHCGSYTDIVKTSS